MKWALNLLIGFYQVVISPLLGRNCRYAPSCSMYAKQSIELHGALRGGYFAIKRIARCHPWGGHGFDPVPGSPEELSGEYTNESTSKLTTKSNNLSKQANETSPE